MSSPYAVLPLPSFASRKASWYWPGLVYLARSATCAALIEGVKEGCLEILDYDGRSIKFGSSIDTKKGPLEGRLVVNDDSFWVRIYLSYDIGFSEAYMNGEVTSPSLKDVFTVYVRNHRLGHISTVWSVSYQLKNVCDIVMHRYLSHGYQQSIYNVAGYDASNELYAAFLSDEMQYSCPIWLDIDGSADGDLRGLRSPNDLERAQHQKIQWVLDQARVKDGHRLLEIGTGWGSLAIAAAQRGCVVDSITLSIEQKLLAEKRIDDAGFSSQIRVHLLDYRKLPTTFEKAFDACVSLEMIEAVGVKYMSTFIRIVDWALKDEDAAVVLSATTFPDATFTTYQANDFIRKYHWPHAIPPSATWIANQFNTVLNRRFSLETVANYSTHYCRCLREWARRLESNWTPQLIQTLTERYPEFRDPHLLEVYKRRWLYMFVYMEVVYSKAWLNLNYWTFVRPGYEP